MCFNKVQPELMEASDADPTGFIFPLDIIITCFKLKDTTTSNNGLFKPVVECQTFYNRLNRRRQTRRCSNTDATERQRSAERKEVAAFILGEMGGETSGVIRRVKEGKHSSQEEGIFQTLV